MLKKIILLLVICIGIQTFAASLNKWEIKRHKGVVTVFHNGKPVILNILYDNDNWKAKYMGALSKGIAHDARINMHMLHVTVDLDGKCPITGTVKAWRKRFQCLYNDHGTAGKTYAGRSRCFHHGQGCLLASKLMAAKPSYPYAAKRKGRIGQKPFSAGIIFQR